MKRKLEEAQLENNKKASVYIEFPDSDDWPSSDSEGSFGSDSDDNDDFDVDESKSVWRNGMGMTMVPKRVWSTPTLSRLLQLKEVEATIQQRIRKSESAIFPSATKLPSRSQKEQLDPIKKPEDCLKEYLQSQGLTLDMISSKEDSFLKISDQDMTRYPEVAHAARHGDLDTLKRMLEKGSPLQCTNSYGESIVHIVCRRGSTHILEFLMNEAKVSVRLKDDVGRTPLHDAVWTAEPNFDLVNVLLADSPDLLLVRDKRGHSALSYIPRTNWRRWCAFIESHQQLIRAALESERIQVTKKEGGVVEIVG